MWATASARPDRAATNPPGAGNRRLVQGWAVFAGLNLGLMFVVPGVETVPFHLVWFSLALVYGLAPWRLRTMVTALAVVTAATATALGQHARAGVIGLQEVTEVPLMAAIFLAMVWHVRRRQVALHQLEQLAAGERRRAESEQMFVRLVSHEMRTPITVARGYTELIRSAHADPQTDEDTAIVLDELAKLDRSTQRLVTLITADQPAATEPVDLDQILERAARRWEPTAGRRWLVASTAGTAMLDPERLETALDCLLENAVKHTAEGDTIELRGHREPDHVVIQVADTGTGIPPHDLPHVFTMFHRGANSRSPHGTGLGLSIVHRITQACAGTTEVASTVCSGATFTLRFPIPVHQRPANPRPDPRAGARPAAAPLGGRRTAGPPR